MSLTTCQTTVLRAIQDWLYSNGQFFVLSGAAGTGKSYLLQSLVNWIHEENKFNKALGVKAVLDEEDILISATTHNAKNLLEIEQPLRGRMDTYTIHNLLNIKVKDDLRTGKTYLDLGQAYYKNELRDKLVIIDEASMLDVEILDYLIQFKDIKILLVCDAAQLPPVGSDLPAFLSYGFPMVDMKTNVRSQHNPEFCKFLQDYREDILNHKVNYNINCNNIKVVSQEEFNQLLKTSFVGEDAQVNKFLAYTNTSVNKANSFLKNYYTGTSNFEVGETAIVHGANIKSGLVNLQPFWVHTSVPHTFELNYWNNKKEVLENLKIKGRKINNRFFVPDEINQIKTLTKKFIVSYKQNAKALETIRNEWLDLRPRYALTINRSQGQTYQDIFVDIHSLRNLTQNPLFLTRMLYVAFSRAQRNIYITGGIV